MTQNKDILHYPDNWPNIKPKQIAWFLGIPILSLLSKFWLGLTKWSYAYSEIFKQLKARGSVPDSVWGDNPVRIQMAKVLEKVAQNHIWVSDVYFIPEDPFDIVYNLTIGDLCEVEAIMTLEDIFKIKIGDDFVALLYKSNMSEAVDLFLDKMNINEEELDCYLKDKSFSKKSFEIPTVWGFVVILIVIIATIVFLFIK